jgi:hypothetical protein
MATSKARGAAFRDAVLVVLNEHGVRARRRAEPKGLPPAERIRASVTGVDRWAISTRNSKSLDLGVAVSEAERAAAAEGATFYAAVQPRRGFPVELSYVTTTLDVLVALIKEQDQYADSPDGSCRDRLLTATVATGR